MPRCPTCKKEAKPREENRAFPFCSERCKAIDLGKWFTGEYRVPGRKLQPGEQPAGSAGPEDGETGEERDGSA
jgi:endogenous inhibitor of DNA gyrase (YacG/DUF329 family)